MDDLVVVTYPEALNLEARQIEHEAVPEGSIGLGYYVQGRLVARGVVTEDAVQAIGTLLRSPVNVALAATEDDEGNIEGRFCLVLPIDADQMDGDEENEPWRASIPKAPNSWGSAYDESDDEDDDDEGDEDEDDGSPRIALLPLGNVIRSAQDRRHPEHVEDDAREMLDNLIGGRAQDAVSKAIDDLLKSL